MQAWWWTFTIVSLLVGSLGFKDSVSKHSNVHVIKYAIENVTESAIGSKVCSSRFGEFGVEMCFTAHMKIWKFTVKSLLNHLSDLDSDNKIRNIHIDIHIHPSQNGTNFDIQIGDVLDSFIAPRPWWMIAKESTPSHSKQREHTVVLVRIQQDLENHLLMVSKIQYPPVEGCETTKLVLGHMVNSGWGAHMNTFSPYWGANPFVIFNIWDSNTNKPDEGVAYATKTLCPTTINKRLCAFLPLTNCTMPDFLTTFSGSHDEVKKRLWSDGAYMVYSSATTNGSQVIGNDRSATKPKSAYHKHLHSLLSDKINPTFRTSYFIDGNGDEIDYSNQHGAGNPPAETLLASHGMIWRPNAVYRSLVNKRIEEIRREQDFADDIECVAMHIRRGDRTYSNINITDFCRSHHAYSPVNCTTWDGTKYNCQDLTEKGCFYNHAFGSLTLQDYLHKSWQLHKTKNVFVVTDDDDWLAEEKKKIGVEWKVAVLPARRESRRHDSPYATENGVDFVASVALARQCQAFVGHWGSAVSHLLYHAMCMQHGNGQTVGQCPKGCDLSLPPRRLPLLATSHWTSNPKGKKKKI